MAAAFPQRTRPGLTRDLWLNIARYLDADSLFSFEESKLVNIDFLESWEATEAVVLSPHSNDEYLAAFLDCIDVNNVRSVCVANCLMASPDHLLDRISSLSNLVKLDCVNCRISPRHLVRTISTSLPKLKKLCFSIDCEFSGHPIFVENVVICRYFVPTLRSMYVEVSGVMEAYSIVTTIVTRCLRLTHLHVHDVSTYTNSRACANIVSVRWHLTNFTFTSQNAPILSVWPEYITIPASGLQLTDISITAAISGNVAYRLMPDTRCTCVILEDIYNSQELETPEQQLILAIEDSDKAPAMLLDVAQKPWWSSYRSLQIAPLRRRDSPHDAVIRPVKAASLTALLRLFDTCANLTELNLTFCHFDCGLDWRNVVASGAFVKIRALSLAQCALTTVDSVEGLASSCPMLEELDVRALRASWTGRCGLCCQPIVSLNTETVKTLCERTRLERFTLCDTSQERCLHWLSQVRVVQLRLSWLPLRCCLTEHMAIWLSVSHNLRSLTLMPSRVDFRAVCTEVRKFVLPSLRELIIHAGGQIYRESVRHTITKTLKHLPAIGTFHVHFPDCQYRCHEQTVTWTRRICISEEAAQQEVLHGDFIFGAPCPRDCSMDTFIGLIKPHS